MKYIVLAVLLLVSHTASANISSNLNSFYQGLGANVTPSGVYQSQAGGYFTGGGLFMRTPNRTYNLLTVTPPSLSAGCGGIDMYLGGFSFINKSQFTQMLQNIGNNAVGYAFNLALQTFAPQIYTTMDTLQKKIQQMTDFSVNSCEAAQKLVNGAFGEISAHSNYACKNLALNHGRASDAAAAEEFCKSPANARNVLNPAALTPSEKSVTFTSRNILWHGLSKNATINQDPAMKGYLMTLVGTVVSQTAQGGEPDVVYYPPLGPIHNAVQAIMYGDTNVLMYQCGANDPDCLNPITSAGTITGIVPDVRTALDEIRTQLEAEATTGPVTTSLSPATMNLLAVSSIPIIKMMTNAVALGPSVALQIENELVDPIAFDIASFYLDWAFTTAKEGINQNKGVPKEMYQKYMASVRDRQKDFRALKASKKVTSSFEIIKKAQFLEKLLIANLTPHFQEVMQYSKGF